MFSFAAISLFLKSNFKWIVIGVLSMAVAGFVWSWGSRGEDIAKLEAQIEKLETINKTLAANVDIERLNQELQQAGTDELGKRLDERNKHLEELCKTWNKIDEKDTDPVGTVLDSLGTGSVQ